MKWVIGFGRFWYDFLIGDSIALAIGGIGVLALGYLMVEADAEVAAEVVLPLVAAGTIWVSLRNA
jgi:hypothetical protein